MQLSGLISSKGVCQGWSIYNLKSNHKNMNLFKMFMKLCSHSVCSTFLPSVAFILLHCVGFFHCQFLVKGFLGFPHGEGNGTPLQYSCLENPMDGGAWQAAVNGVAKSRTRLSNFPFPFHFHALEKEMATHSSVLAWRIPGTGETRGLPSIGSHRVGLD